MLDETLATLNNLQNPISIILVIIILITIIFVLYTTNRKLNQQLGEEQEKAMIFLKQLKEIKNLKQNKEHIESLNKLARDFFNERLGLQPSLTYLELGQKFKEVEDKESTQFCDLMTALLYSGKQITSEETNKAMNLFENILEKED